MIKPNIILFIADDMAALDMSHLPKTNALITARGMSFPRSYVTYALCGPSRATMLTGMYAHNHRVITNSLPLGGEPRFRQLGHDTRTFAVWLKGAGYRTAYVGKYMNAYMGPHVPPGWDDFRALAGAYHIELKLAENGTINSYADVAIDDLLTERAVSAVEANAGGDAPLLLVVGNHAPHSPNDYPERHAGHAPGGNAPRAPSFNVSDPSHPRWVRDLPALTQTRIDALDSSYRARLRSLQALDDCVEAVYRAVERRGELANTYFLFSSDNGYHFGEHKIYAGKWTEFEEAMRTPMVVSGPGVAPGASREEFVLNNDVAATLCEQGGAAVGPTSDGRSFAPLLRGEQVPWRTAFLFENWQKAQPNGAASPSPTFTAVRTLNFKYLENVAGEASLYPLHADEYELTSRHATASANLRDTLKGRLEALRDCAGHECRQAEGFAEGP